ncbi:MAG TPA: HAMP domain-containing sensor histidine kinase [Hyphomicrobium sp.]|nr:HAMP domain-containing sensor histidine kinase [Hyphomicrobium sp.]
MAPRSRPALFKPVLLVAAIGAIAVAIALLTLVFSSSKALRLVQPAHAHLQYMARLNDVSREMHRLLARQFDTGPPPASPEIELARNKLARLIAQEQSLSIETSTHLAKARVALAEFAKAPSAALLTSLLEIEDALDLESKAHAKLMDEMHDYALAEYRLAIITLVALPLIAAAAFLPLRARVLHSIQRLAALLERLSRRDFAPVAIDEDAGEFKPVLETYNHLIERLTAAEAENAVRQKDLEGQVRAASRALLRQGRALAEADRLAAVGEASARIAHELRNPLAGIELALANLRAESDVDGAAPNQELHGRLGPMIAELQRMSRLMTGLLEAGARPPERAAHVALRPMVEETATLVRYQTHDDIEINSDIASGLACFLPPDTLRQVVFNLLLNSVQAIGGRAGQIRLSAIAKDCIVTLVIEDDGPGLPADLLTNGPRMFDSRRKGGTGIGLATVRRLVDGMGGQISFANGEHQGARIQVELPCRRSDA